jgi:predicted phosphodiesterase|tara:strand:+ start:1920 stop:2777 length:858 start_codon:yes stop_codon:yes gene_type:complete
MDIQQVEPMSTVINLNKDDLKPFLFASDVHWDSKHCQRDVFKRHLEEVKAQDGYVVIIGDFFDLMEGRNDFRRSNKLRSEHLGTNYLQKVVLDAVEWLKPYAKNIVLISDGNHETSITKNIQVDPLEWLCYELRKLGSPVIHGNYQGFLTIRYNYAKSEEYRSPTLKYTVFYHHGLWGGVVSQGTQSVMRYSSIVPDADMIITGHTHNQWQMINTRYKINNAFNTYLNEQLHLKLGTYKQEFQDGKGWAVEKLGIPKPIGAWWVNFAKKKRESLNVLIPSVTMAK